jgi:hypothetical protein
MDKTDGSLFPALGFSVVYRFSFLSERMEENLFNSIGNHAGGSGSLICQSNF